MISGKKVKWVHLWQAVLLDIEGLIMVASNKSNDQHNYSKWKCCTNKWATINHYHRQEGGGTIFWQLCLYFLLMIMNVSSICVTKSSLMHSDLNISSPPIPTEEEHLLKFSTGRLSHQPFGKFIFRLFPPRILEPLWWCPRKGNVLHQMNEKWFIWFWLAKLMEFLTSRVEPSPPEQLQVVDSNLSNRFII